MMTQQILFRSKDQGRQRFENFYAAENMHLLDAIKAFLETDEFGCFYLYGQPGSGKTHLLKAVCQAQPKAQYLDLDQALSDLASLSTLPASAVIALDNFHHLGALQSAMMLIVESLKLTKGKVIIASTLAPKALSLSLRDLESRLMAGQVFELKRLCDRDKANALRFRAGLRGIKLSDEVIAFIIHRYPRDFHTLFGLLDKLDDASLSRQRPLTVPFIKKLESEC